MTFPANPIREAAPYGPQPVLRVVGPQGGPYAVDGPLAQSLFPLASRSATVQSATQNNYRYRGLYLYLGVTANPGGAQTLAVAVYTVAPSTGGVTAILTVPASATPGGLFLLYPGASGAAIESVTQTRNLVLPPQWLVIVTHSGVGAWTYAVDALLLP